MGTMLRLVVALFALLLGSVFRPDDSPAGDPPGDPGDDPPAGDPPAGDPPADEIVVRFKNEDERQEWLDRQFSGRYKRKQEEIREEERERIQAELEEEQRKEKGEYKELYEQAERKIDEQATRITELEGKVSDVEEKDRRIETLEEQVKAFIEPDLERVPEHFRELVSEMSLDQQASWLTRNRDKLEGADDPVGSPPTPRPRDRDQRRERAEEDKEVAERQRQRVASRL